MTGHVSLVIQWRALLMETSELSPTELLVGFVLSTHMDRNGGSCFPGISTVAAEAHCSRRQAQGSVRKLERLGLLDTKVGGGRGRPNRYRINSAAVALFSTKRAQYTTQKGTAQEDVQEDVHNFSSTRKQRAQKKTQKKKGARAYGATPEHLAYLDQAGEDQGGRAAL